MSNPSDLRVGRVLSAIKGYRLGLGVELNEVVGLVVGFEAESPLLYREFAVDLVVQCDQLGTLEALDRSGFVSRIASDSSHDLLRAAAFVNWRLGRVDVAATLELAAIMHALSLPESMASMLSLEERVRSAIDNYRSAGSSEARAAAWESYSQLDADSEEMRLLAEEFVEALESHSHLNSEVGSLLLRRIGSAAPEQSLLRLAAFVAWRRGDSAEAAELQGRSLLAPNLLWSPVSIQSEALRANERPDLFPSVVRRRVRN